MELRDYQKECIEIVDNLPDGSRTIVCLATGLGKTVTASRFKSKGRVLWLSHRDELVYQPKRYYNTSFGIEKGKDTSDKERVVSASVQSLAKDNRLKKFKPTDFDIIICDEAHHAAAPTYKKILGYFKPRKLIGLTATPKRGDGVKLTDVFDTICFTRDLKWGIENNYLTRIQAVRVSAAFDFKKMKTSMGDLQISSMAKEMLQSDDDIVVTKAYLEYCVPEHKKTLIYCPTINVCILIYETMCRTLPKEEVKKIAVLSEKNTPQERKDILSGYMDGDINCIINCMILTEGTDLPATSVIINNRPTANDSLYQQIVGRGVRLYDNKEYCLIIDVIGKNCKARNIVTAPTLFGIDPEQMPESVRKELEGKDLLEISKELLDRKSRAAIAMKLRKEMIDIFTGERLKLIQENNTLEELAKAYEAAITSQDDGFGDIMVKLQPEEDKYYCIPATYNGNIYISKPDMLNKCFVTIDIPNSETIDGKTWDGVSNPMDYEAAKNLVNDLLKYSIDKKYAIKWSKSARRSLNNFKASDKQSEYVERLYKKSASLTKLQASDLIELNRELNDLKERKRRLELEEIRSKGQQAIPQEDTDTKRHEDYKKIIIDMSRKKIAYEKEVNKCIGKEDSFNVAIPAAYTKTIGPTKKQIDYLEGLKNALNYYQFTYNVNIEDQSSMYIVSILIDMFRHLRTLKELPDNLRYNVTLKGDICTYRIEDIRTPIFEEISYDKKKR